MSTQETPCFLLISSLCILFGLPFRVFDYLYVSSGVFLANQSFCILAVLSFIMFTPFALFIPLVSMLSFLVMSSSDLFSMLSFLVMSSSDLFSMLSFLVMSSSDLFSML